MPEWRLLFDLERQRCRVPPNDGRPVSCRAVQAGSDRAVSGRPALGPAFDYAIISECGAGRCRLRMPAGVIRRVHHRVEHV